MYNEQVEVVEKKASYFYKNDISVHVKFKEGFWKRGKIVELGADFMLLEDFKDGRIVIFFLELKDIEPYKEIRK